MHSSFDPRLVATSAQPRAPGVNTENEIDDIEDHHFKAKHKERNDISIDTMDKASTKTSLACLQWRRGRKGRISCTQ